MIFKSKKKNLDANLCQYMVENMETAVLLFDEHLKLKAINQSAEYLLQTSSSRLLGKNDRFVFPFNTECQDILAKVLRENRSITEREVRLRLLNGNVITVDFIATPINRSTEDVSEVIVEILGVDRLLRIAREENIAEQFEATKQVLRGIAHEIKNPLGGLRGAAQLLDMELDDESQKEYTRIIIKEADRLTSMIDNMVGPNRPLELKPVNIHECLEHVSKLISAEYPDMVTIERHYDPSLPEIQGDRDALTQVILNISRNAVQAMLDENDASGNEPNRLSFSTRPVRRFTIGNDTHRQALQLDIEDNGPGVPEHLHSSLFFPLVTGKPEGTGLGLSIVQNIINQHHGMVEFSSERGKTVFTIFLPLVNGNGK
jgi:two-component system nitrogen regulation sensor histidine kinase GlnL